MAAYLRTGGGIVALVGPGGVRLPNAMALPQADYALMARHATAGPHHVGGGGVQIGPVGVVAGRWWDPVPRLGQLDPRALAARLDELRLALPPWPDPHDLAARRLEEGRDVLAAALGGDGTFEAAANRLVGLGAGLTPAGDDLLAGTMAGLVVFGKAIERPEASALAAEMRRAVAEHAGGTTPLAADLAEHAARGALVQPAADLCRVIADQRRGAGRALRPALESLLRLGHTSGHDLAEGLVIGASAAIHSSC